ncbi:MAG: iron-containing alcohol dehydrogenase, partial [Spirochaetota bacterium]|nr:iron-containing alcohol dehydrogenase [Spirochaetota bacterium]
MTNFEFYSPTKVIFGKDVVSRLGQEAKEFGGKALLLYGRESIKKNGLYDLIVKQCAEAGIELTEHSGVSPNPVLSHASEGVRIAREADVDFIIAAGGGSVIDESKVISAGTANDAPLWDLVSRKAPVEKALPIVAIQTLPATSSETNQVGVLTNKETNEKFSIKSPLLVPAKAFLDPQLTFTIPKKYSAYACFDIMSHMLEGYFTTTADFAPAHEGFVEGLSGAVKISLDRILKDPEDYEARA